MRTLPNPTSRLIKLAQSRGSTAKTLAGAKKYLATYMSSTSADCLRGLRWTEDRQSQIRPVVTPRYYATRSDWDNRNIETRADRRAAILGYATTNRPEWDDYCEAYLLDRQITEWTTAQAQSISLPDALSRTYTASWDTPKTRIYLSANYCAIVTWTTASDWEYYAKSYGKPKNTYSNRRVEIYKKLVDTPVYVVHVDSFRGEFLRASIIEAGQKLQLPWLIEAVRAIPTRTQRLAEQLATPRPCYKRVAVRPDGTYVSIYDGQTTYNIGETVRDEIKRCPDYDDICGYGGIFVHETREAAETQKYPKQSEALDLPRVTLRGEYWGRTNTNGKIAVEYFRPVEVMNE